MSKSSLLVRTAAALGMSVAPAFAQNATPQPAPNVPPVTGVMYTGVGNNLAAFSLPHASLEDCVSAANQFQRIWSISSAACIVHGNISRGLIGSVHELVWRDSRFQISRNSPR